MLYQVDDASTARHVRHRAVPRTNRTPAPSSRAYQQKSDRVERGRHCYAIMWFLTQIFSRKFLHTLAEAALFLTAQRSVL
jgi:hypothetical protein